MKTNSKAKTFLCLLSITICCLIYSCKKTERSEPLDKTDLVSSNVTQYSFGVQDLTTGFKQLTVTTTKDTVDNSAWFVYLYNQALDRWYIVPGYGYGGTTNYRLSFSFTSGKFNIFIDKIGVGEKYEKAKIVRIFSRNREEISNLKKEGYFNLDIHENYK